MPEVVDFGGGQSPLASGLSAVSSFLGGFAGGKQAQKREIAAQQEQEYLNRLRDLKIAQLEQMAAEDSAADKMQEAMTGPLFDAAYLDLVNDFKGTLFADIGNELRLIPDVDYEGALTPEALRIFRDPNLNQEDRRRFMDILKQRQRNALQQGELGRFDGYVEGQKANQGLAQADENYHLNLDSIRDDPNITVPEKLNMARAETARVRTNFVTSIRRSGAQQAFNSFISSSEFDAAFSSQNPDTFENEVDGEAQGKWTEKWEEYIAKGNYSAANGMIRRFEDPDTGAYFDDLERQMKTLEEAKNEANRRLGVSLGGGYDSEGREEDMVPRPVDDVEDEQVRPRPGTEGVTYPEPAGGYRETTDDEGLPAEGSLDPEGAPSAGVLTEDELSFSERFMERARDDPESLRNPFEEVGGRSAEQIVTGSYSYVAPDDRPSMVPGQPGMGRGSGINVLYEAADEFWKAGGGADGQARARLHMMRHGVNPDIVTEESNWLDIRDTHPDNLRNIFWETPEGLQESALVEAMHDRPVGVRKEFEEEIGQNLFRQDPSEPSGVRKDRAIQLLEEIDGAPGARGKDGVYDSFVEYGAYKGKGWKGAGAKGHINLWLDARREGLPLPVFAYRQNYSKAMEEIGHGDEQWVLSATASAKMTLEEYKTELEKGGWVPTADRPVELGDVSEPDPAPTPTERVADAARAAEQERAARAADKEQVESDVTAREDLEMFFLASGMDDSQAREAAAGQDLGSEVMTTVNGDLKKWRRDKGTGMMLWETAGRPQERVQRQRMELERARTAASELKSLREETSYDMDTAVEAELEPDWLDGTWPSRVPDGEYKDLILKAPSHPTWNRTLKEEEGRQWWQDPKTGRYYTSQQGLVDFHLGLGLVKVDPPEADPTAGRPGKPRPDTF